MSSWTGNNQTHDSSNDWTSDLHGHDLPSFPTGIMDIWAQLNLIMNPSAYSLQAGSPEGPTPEFPISDNSRIIPLEQVDSSASFHTALTHQDSEALGVNLDSNFDFAQWDTMTFTQSSHLLPRIITDIDGPNFNTSLNNFTQLTPAEHLSPLNLPAFVPSPASSSVIHTPFTSPQRDVGIHINASSPVDWNSLALDASRLMTAQCLQQRGYPSFYGQQPATNDDPAPGIDEGQLALPKASLAMFSNQSSDFPGSSVVPPTFDLSQTSMALRNPGDVIPSAIAPSLLHFADYAEAIVPAPMMHPSAALASPLELSIDLQHQFTSPQNGQAFAESSSAHFTSVSRGRRSKKQVNYKESPASTADDDEYLPSIATSSISSRKVTHKVTNKSGQRSTGPIRNKRGGQTKRRRHSPKDIVMKFVPRATLDAMLVLTDDGRLQCTFTESDGQMCCSITRRPGDARRHLGSAHGFFDDTKGHDGFRCDYCDTSYMRKDALRRHQVDGWCVLDPDQGDHKKRRLARQAENLRKAEGKTSNKSSTSSR